MKYHQPRGSTCNFQKRREKRKKKKLKKKLLVTNQNINGDK